MDFGPHRLHHRAASQEVRFPQALRAPRAVAPTTAFARVSLEITGVFRDVSVIASYDDTQMPA